MKVRPVVAFTLYHTAVNGHDLIRQGYITAEQLCESLTRKRVELDALTDTDIAARLLLDLPPSAFSHA